MRKSNSKNVDIIEKGVDKYKHGTQRIPRASFTSIYTKYF